MNGGKFAKIFEALADLVNAGKLAELTTEPLKKAAAIRHVLLPDPASSPRDDISDAALLRSEYRIVRFDYRQAEFDDFVGWCNSNEEYAWRLVHGDTGRGKTRLMVELCSYLNGDATGNDWVAGIVNIAQFQSNPDAFELLFSSPKPLFVVVDYAERHSVVVTELLKRSRQRGLEKPGSTTRIVLVARRRSEIWDQMFRQDEQLQQVKRDALADFRLASVTDTHDVAAVFASAYADIARHYRVTRPPPVLDFGHIVPGRAKPDIGLVHMLALIAVIAPEELGHGKNARPTQDEILSFLLGREKRHWCKAAAGLRLPPELQQEALLAEAAALFTLASQQGAIANSVEARKVLRAGALLRDQPEAQLDRVASVFRETYPGIGYVNGIAPDLLGDFLIMDQQKVPDVG